MKKTKKPLTFKKAIQKSGAYFLLNDDPCRPPEFPSNEMMKLISTMTNQKEFADFLNALAVYRKERLKQDEEN